MRAALKAYGVEDRSVWVADSFEGLPEPDADKYPLEAKAFLHTRGIDLSGEQRTKTKTALEFFSAQLR